MVKNRMYLARVLWLVLMVASTGLAAHLARADDDLLAYLDRHEATYDALARALWELAELGYLETESSGKLQARLREEGFDIQAGVAGMPTAFVATWGKGEPVIAILAEFDALPGISQAAEPVRKIVPGKSSGHACGHHLFGAGATAAAVAVRHWLARNKAGGKSIPGTIRLYGTPAEEGGSGKVYMVRAGLFDDVDTVLHWHPSDRNSANAETTLANKSARFRFSGVSSHAAAAPERGRSALDGVEAMNFMVNMLREHIPQTSRIHYVITRGGEAPNVVPDDAEVYYYVRHPDAIRLMGIWERVLSIARAAALGTGTTVAVEVMHGNHSMLPNEVLARVMHGNLTRVGGVTWTDAERQFAETIKESLDMQSADIEADLLGMESMIQPLALRPGMGSTDVGDVSWVVPTAGLRTATWVPGTSAHSWQAIAAGGMSIGTRGMQVAARVLALTARDLFLDPALIADGKAELELRRGANFSYRPLLGDRSPPLGYRLK